MQHGETGAPLPRALAKQYGRQVCDRHNSEQRATTWVNRFTGRPLDASGTVVVERKPRKRIVKPPRS